MTISSLWNQIGEWLNEFLLVIINLLPESPFTVPDPPAEVVEAMGFINWLVPVGTIISITLGWVTCIFIYYTYILILRWTKAIQ